MREVLGGFVLHLLEHRLSGLSVASAARASCPTAMAHSRSCKETLDAALALSVLWALASVVLCCVLLAHHVVSVDCCCEAGATAPTPRLA